MENWKNGKLEEWKNGGVGKVKDKIKKKNKKLEPCVLRWLKGRIKKFFLIFIVLFFYIDIIFKILNLIYI
jgi:hypothetical protein